MAQLKLTSVKPTRLQIRLTVLLFACLVFASGCVGARTGVSWPALSLVTIGDNTAIAVSYNHFITMVDPLNGNQTTLLNSDGEPRRDSQGDIRRWNLEGEALKNLQFFTPPIETPDSDEFLYPTYDGGNFENNRIMAIDSVSGTVDDATAYSLPGPVVAMPLVVDDLIIVPIKTGNIVALERDSNNQAWLFETDEGVWSSPVYHDGIIYFTTMDHHLFALDALTGESVWDESVDIDGAGSAPPLVTDEFIYVGSFSHDLYKISLGGQIVGEYEAVNWIWSTPVLSDSILYTTDLSGYVHAVNADTMEKIWSVKVAERGIRAAPLVVGNRVIVASRDGRVYWLSREDGGLVQSAEIDGRPEILSDILLITQEDVSGLANDLIIVSTTDTGKLVAAFSLETANPVWVYNR